MTQQQIDKLMNSKEFNDAAFYLGGNRRAPQDITILK